MSIYPENMKFLLMIGSVLVAALFLLPQLVWLLAWAAGKIFAFRVAYKPFLIASCVLVALSLCVFVYGYTAGRTHYEVKHVDLEFVTLPQAFDGYRIVQISDLHLGLMHGCEDFLSAAVDEINSMNPDAICFTGDLVSGTHEEMDGLTPILQKLSAKDGVFSVMGNHDYAPYIEMDDSLREKEISVLQERVRGELAWVLLLNQNMVIKRGNDSIAIAGVENQSYSFTRHLQYGDLKKALKGVDGVFTVLLSHDPTHWRAEILPETDVPLTLSGHTHAAQIKIFGYTPASWVFKETDGLYEEDGRYLYVNIGLGGVVPFRLGATPEITVIDLHCKR